MFPASPGDDIARTLDAREHAAPVQKTAAPTQAPPPAPVPPVSFERFADGVFDAVQTFVQRTVTTRIEEFSKRADPRIAELEAKVTKLSQRDSVSLIHGSIHST